MLIHLSRADALALAFDIMTHAGARPEVAGMIADCLVRAECDGVLSHGLSRLPDHVASIRAHWADPAALPDIVQVRPGLLRADGGNGFTPVAASMARNRLTEMARQEGLAALCVRNTHHLGALWCDIEPLAEEGLVAASFVHSRPRMAPYGAKKALIGTNAMAFAFPDGRGGAITFDQASSVLSVGDVRRHAREGRPLPPAAGLTREGSPTTAADDIMNGGPLLPFGGHKGASIALMVEIMAAAMTGAAFGFEDHSSRYPGAASSNAGLFLLVMDPAITSGNDATERFMHLIAHLHSDPDIRLPGERRHANRAHAMQNGITIEEDLANILFSLRP
ncbi:malate/L-lactate dehydrogenase [Acetobacter malorum DSM 14337]|uniref:Malate/L-lactate dehydrogenase n=1 Tax=Acetobacter malorum DSM 14337 TaxID=1307910 RepID=A0ABQ0PUE6_9PROT|nr:Ldh family oxidoreductase [Acetobacter malorum]GBQ80265.1 malate/L-lactate dehydrogenase [Acetobacter malorum DSM 14337]